MRIIIIISLLLSFTMGYGQHDISLKWFDMETTSTINNTDINYLYFENSSLANDYGALPIFTFEKESPDNSLAYDFEILNPIYDTLSIALSSLLSDSDLIPETLEQWTDINNSISKFSLVALKRLNKTNQVLLLKDFTLNYQLVPNKLETQELSFIPEYANNSVLAQGVWLKMAVVNTAVHKLDYDFFISQGIEPTNLNLNTIGVFGNYDGLLNEDNAKARPDDLKENSILLIGMDDGSFDEDDYILFYAKGADGWRYNPFTSRFDHLNNIYSDTTYYYFTPDRGSALSLTNLENESGNPTQIVNSYVEHIAHENDWVNLMSSGKEWFGERLSMDEPEVSFNYDLPNLIIEKSIYLNFDIVARAFENSSYKVFVNNQIVVDSTRISKVDPASEGIYARQSNRTETFYTHDRYLNLTAQYNTLLSSASAWVNYFVFNFESKLKYESGQMAFRQPAATALGNISQFNIETSSNELMVWDVTKLNRPVNILFEADDDFIRFTQRTDSLREFVVFDNNSFESVVDTEKIENQDLHSITEVDFVIISPEKFQEQAYRLASLHQQNDGLRSIVVSPQQIYNEFSSGSQDVTAIRDFMRMLYLKGCFTNGPGYLLMFGDGSFDYKHRIHENTNIVPTYESAESLRATSSYVTDDFFGLLDEDEGAYCEGVLDIGIGRFPISTLEEAVTAVDKVEAYLKKDMDAKKEWSKTICFVADDGDNNLHFKQANFQLAPIVDTLHPGFEVSKIYSDSYAKVEVPSGYRYPDVSPKINNQVHDGALIINYTGHGGLIGWSEELILDVPMINSFENQEKLPLFITATCEFSRFDNPEFTSAGEYVFLNEKGGGIGLFTTTRLAYAHANIIVNMRIYNNLLEREDGTIPRLGDLIRMSKNPSSSNFLNFTLLGDPALRLAIPFKEVRTTSINDRTPSTEADTINALMEVYVEGFILDENGNTDIDFNGFLYPKVYDKASQYRTLGNPGGSYPADFEVIDKVLYNGKVSVKEGLFKFSFLVPKDISYNYGFGKISYYAFDTIRFVDAWGGFEDILIGGLNEDFVNTEEGPQVSLFLNNKEFISGDKVSKENILMADLFDEDGINSTGHSLGRDIIAIIDGNNSISLNLNEYFESEVDTYKSGSLNYALDELEEGWHTISLKAWDLMNNSSEVSIEFYVEDKSSNNLSEVYNYPNPFVGNTTFNFKNNANTLIEKVEIQIFNIQGQYVISLYEEMGESGQNISSIEWDGKDHNGNLLPDGVYLYNIFVTDQVGITMVQQQKMIKWNE